MPIWFLLAATHNPYTDFWRCSRCGQRAGELTPEQAQALQIERASQEAIAARENALKQAERDKQKAAVKERRKQKMDELG